VNWLAILHLVKVLEIADTLTQTQPIVSRAANRIQGGSPMFHGSAKRNWRW